jgi:hypothetical protein
MHALAWPAAAEAVATSQQVRQHRHDDRTLHGSNISSKSPL